jgi:hypothetical protein
MERVFLYSIEADLGSRIQHKLFNKPKNTEVSDEL